MRRRRRRIRSPFIDRRSELDAAARGKPAIAPKARAKQTRARNPAATPDDGGQQLFLQYGEEAAALLAGITDGEDSHNAIVALAGRLAWQDVPPETVVELCLRAAQQRPNDERDAGWHALIHGEIQRNVEGEYAKHAGRQAEEQRVLALVPAIARERASPESNRGNGSSPPALPSPPSGGGAGGGGGGSGGGPRPGPGPGTGPGSGPTQKPQGFMRYRRPTNECNADNVAIALRQLPALIGCVAYDEFSLRLMLQAPLPGDSKFTAPRPWADVDAIRLQTFLQRHAGMNRISLTNCHNGAALVGYERSYHPVRDSLKSLRWDGTKRLDTWAHVYLGAENTEYTRTAPRMWLISMVARVFEPGCQCDYMLVLEGKQRRLKSSVFRTLAGDAWFSDESLNLRHDLRAANQHLPGNWIIEIAELQSFKGAALETVKTFITQREAKYLRRYARAESFEKRQCVLGATTNEHVYLYDPTGNARFWPLKVLVTGPIDIRRLKADRDQLLAEAVVRYRDDEHWWPDPELEDRLFVPEQDARYDADSWTQFVLPYLDGLINNNKPAQEYWDKCIATGRRAPTPERPVARTTSGEVYRTALKDPNDPFHPELAPVDFDRTAQLKVRDILTKAGWQVTGKSNGSWVWEYPH
jgi:predicted P-loop ATPase